MHNIKLYCCNVYFYKNIDYNENILIDFYKKKYRNN